MRELFKKRLRMGVERVFLIYITLLQIGCCQIVNGQIKIYSDDSTELYIEGFTNQFDQHYYSVPFSDLKSHLPDGSYAYYSLRMRDSAKFGADKYLKIKGQYLNNQRSGQFVYYSTCGHRDKKRVMTDLLNYKEGLLNGYCMSQTCVSKIYEGYYTMGKRDGFFLSYDEEGEIAKIELFKNDTLLYWSVKPDITVPHRGQN